MRKRGRRGVGKTGGNGGNDFKWRGKGGSYERTGEKKRKIRVL